MDSRRIGVPRQHYAVTVDTVQLTHHVLDGNTASTNYAIHRIILTTNVNYFMSTHSLSRKVTTIEMLDIDSV